MRDTEFETLSENEKHFMRTFNAEKFVFVVSYRQQGPSPEDCAVWGLTHSRIDYLLQSVAMHQTRAARLAGLEKHVAEMADLSRLTIRGRLLELRNMAERSALEIKAVIALLEKMS